MTIWLSGLQKVDLALQKDLAKIVQHKRIFTLAICSCQCGFHFDKVTSTCITEWECQQHELTNKKSLFLLCSCWRLMSEKQNKHKPIEAEGRLHIVPSNFGEG